MTGIYPIASFGARSLQALQPLTAVRQVNPVVRDNSGAPSARAPDNKDKVSLSPAGPRAGDGLYTRKGTLVTSVDRQQTFDLTIQTAEGDTATLSFSQASGSTSSVSALSAPNGSRVETLLEDYGALDMQISTRGSFNDQETQAMDQLMEQANRVADAFFAGNTEAATAGAQKLQLTDNALQSFSMDLSSQEMRRVSATYEEVARFSAPPPPPAPSTPAQPSSEAGTDMLQGLKQLLAQLVSDAKDTRVVTNAVDKTALA